MERGRKEGRQGGGRGEGEGGGTLQANGVRERERERRQRGVKKGGGGLKKRACGSGDTEVSSAPQTR